MNEKQKSITIVYLILFIVLIFISTIVVFNKQNELSELQYYMNISETEQEALLYYTKIEAVKERYSYTSVLDFIGLLIIILCCCQNKKYSADERYKDRLEWEKEQIELQKQNEKEKN